MSSRTIPRTRASAASCALLSDNATVVISGTRIAEELGTTRSEVWRAVQHLRELGVQITGHPSTGYQLEAVPDLLLPDILGPHAERDNFRFAHSSLLPHRLDQRHRHAIGGEGRTGRRRVPRRAADCRPRTRRTTLGVGAIGRHLLLCGVASGVFSRRRPAPLADCRHRGGAKRLSRSRACIPICAGPTTFCWAARKFCGILTEMNAEATRVRYVVVGIGINVNHASFSGELEPIATSLRMESGRAWSRVELTAALLKSLGKRVPQAC